MAKAAPAKIELGRKVPDFTATTTDGGSWRLAEAKGSKVVLFFYPKDMTSGCTVEAQQFRDLQGAFRKAGAIVIGVSRDSCASHQKFKTKEDAEQWVIDSYYHGRRELSALGMGISLTDGNDQPRPIEDIRKDVEHYMTSYQG